MAETLTTILTAHLLGYLFLQTGWMVKHKQHIGAMLLHVAIVTTVSWLLMGAFHWPILLTIFLMHVAINAIKAFRMTDSLTSFLANQCVHLVVLVGLAWLFPDAATNGWWITALKEEQSKWYFASLSFLSGLILVVPVGGILIAKITSPFVEELNDKLEGLKKGGRYIGWLERSLVMLLLLINQATGIGFLFAAKSILRFGEIKDSQQRKVAEYIIIGTFLSFGWALLISVLTQQAILHWRPPKVPEAPPPTVIIVPSSETSPPTPITPTTLPTTPKKTPPTTPGKKTQSEQGTTTEPKAARPLVHNADISFSTSCNFTSYCS